MRYSPPFSSVHWVYIPYARTHGSGRNDCLPTSREAWTLRSRVLSHPGNFSSFPTASVRPRVGVLSGCYPMTSTLGQVWEQETPSDALGTLSRPLHLKQGLQDLEV